MTKARADRTTIPLIDRRTERGIVRLAIDRGRSTVLTGGLGVGKTRLLHWAEHEAGERDVHVEVIRAHAALSAIPFAALHHLLPMGGADDGPAETVHRMLHRFRTMGAGRPL